MLHGCCSHAELSTHQLLTMQPLAFNGAATEMAEESQQSAPPSASARGAPGLTTTSRGMDGVLVNVKMEVCSLTPVLRTPAWMQTERRKYSCSLKDKSKPLQVWLGLLSQRLSQTEEVGRHYRSLSRSLLSCSQHHFCCTCH